MRRIVRWFGSYSALSLSPMAVLAAVLLSGFVPMQAVAQAAQRGETLVGKTAVLKDALGKPFSVSDVVDIGGQVPPEKFWSLIPPAEAHWDAAINVWQNPLIREFFFGRLPLDAPTDCERWEALPHEKGMLGKPVDPVQPMLIADDIPFHPILRGHGTYSLKYYPRRMQDWAMGTFLPAFQLTGAEKYHHRMRELLDYLLYSQYQPDGSNRFVQTFYPQEYQQLQANGLAKQWRGGWDYLFDWRWLDSYGYHWHLHEPDHHVDSEIAMAMLLGWRLDGDQKYMDAAWEFLHYFVPNYGFHTGVWQGVRYYWTQYDPGGGKAATSATDNIMALVARTVAAMGYYKQDPVLLAYAKGMIWYVIREFKTDGQWYYDGAENPLNQRRAISHDAVVLELTLEALPYLIMSGVSVDELTPPLLEALHWHQENFDWMQPSRYYQGWKTFAGDPKPNTTVGVVDFIKITSDHISKVSLHDPVFADFKAPTPVKFSRLEASRTGWQEAESQALTLEPGERASVTLPMATKRGDIFRIEYSWHVTTLAYAAQPLLLAAGVGTHGTVSKESAVVKPGLRVNAHNFASFPQDLYFPKSPTMRAAANAVP